MSGTNSILTETTTPVDDAIAAFRNGNPVLIHDAADREGETDLVYPAGSVDPGAVSRLRNDAGGLICVALAPAVADAFELPYLHEKLTHPSNDIGDIAYDDHPSFSLTVNHRDTYTGITDRDRSLTITSLADAATTPDTTDFAGTFRTPGHVHLLRAAADLATRQGHTELGIALAAAADTPPAVVVCEMLDDETGGARSPDDARSYATEHDFVYVEGADLIRHLS